VGVEIHSKPITAVGDPPARNTDRDCGEQRPPKRKREVREQAECAEGDPEDFAFHSVIVFSRAIGSAAEDALKSQHNSRSRAKSANSRDLGSHLRSVQKETYGAVGIGPIGDHVRLL
jgi:hypothetical protein